MVAKNIADLIAQPEPSVCDQTRGEPALARLLKEVDPGLASVLTDNAAYVRVIRNNIIEECAKLIERYGLEHMNSPVKDYPATVAAALIYRIRLLATPPTGSSPVKQEERE